MTYNGEMAFNFMHGRGTLEGKGWKFSGTFRNSEIEGDGVY